MGVSSSKETTRLRFPWLIWFLDLEGHSRREELRRILSRGSNNLAKSIWCFPGDLKPFGLGGHV